MNTSTILKFKGNYPLLPFLPLVANSSKSLIRYFCLLISLFFIGINNSNAQQNVFSRSDANTGDWGSGNLPWFYQTSNNNQGDPDNGNTTRNDVSIGHNNFTTMSLNGRFYQHRDFTFQAGASTARTLNNTTGGGFSFTRSLVNASTATHLFNTSVGIDATAAEIRLDNGSGGNFTFNGSVFTNGNQVFARYNNGNTGTITLQGAMTQGGSFVKQNGGTLAFTGSADYSGSIFIDEGIVSIRRNFSSNVIEIGGGVAGTTALNATLEIGVNGGIIVSKNITVKNFNSLGGNRNITFSHPSSTIATISGTLALERTVTITNPSTNNGAFISGVISGAGGLTKAGAGTIQLANVAHSYSGATTVSAGTLLALKTNYTGTVTSSTVVVAFSPAPSNGNYAILPAALTNGGQTFSATGLSSNQTATFNFANSTVTVGSITPSATTLSAFTTTYGNPSAVQTVVITGTNLTGNIVVSAPPTGFEISSNGTNYFTTSINFPNTGGTLSIRLSATANVTGTNYNGQVINLTNGTNTAATATVTTAASGNIVTPAVAAITATASQNKIFGAISPTYTFTTSPSVTTSGALSRVAGENVGTYGYTNGTLASTNANYTLSLAAGTFAITPAVATVTATASQSKVFGSAEITYTFSTSLTVPTSGALSRDAGENVGTYGFTIGTLVSTDANYTLSLAAGTFAITPAVATVTAAASQSKVFGAVEPTYTFSTSPTVPTSGALSRVAGENVGTYGFTIGTLVSTDANYTLSLAEGTFAITPAVATVTATASQSKVFGAADPTYTFSTSPTVPTSGTLSRVAGESVGTYGYINGTLASTDANYTLSLAAGTFAITPAVATVTATSSQSKVFGAADPTYTFSTSPTVATSGSLSRDAGEDVATSPYAFTIGTLVSTDANYTLSVAAGTFAITKATPTATLAVSNSPSTYTGFAQSATVDISASSVTGTVSSILTGASATQTNAGTYAVTASYVPDNTDNYNTLTGLSAGDFVISPIAPTLSVTNTPQDYTGSPIAATVSGTGEGVVSNIKYAGSSTVPTNAGTYAITADIAASANYTAATDLAAGDFVISPIAPILSVTNTPQDYTGSPIAATVSGTGEGVVSNIKYAGSSTAPTNAGTYAITADIAASTNYTAATDAAAGDFVVSSIAPTLSVINAPQNYTGSAITAIVTGIGGGLVSNIKYDGLSTSPTNAGTYAITAYIAASANYTAATDLAAGDFVISPIALTITADNDSKCFGDEYVLGTSAFTSPGLISPETIESVTLISTGADSGASAGSYSIVPSAATGGTFLASNYTFTYTNGTLTVNPTNTTGVASSTPTLCFNTALSDIIHSTTGATGIGTATNLPDGVTATFTSDTITINGTPTVSGTFNYTIPLTGGCGSVNASGTIIVNDIPATTARITASDVNLCKYIGTTYTVTYTANPVAGAVSYIWTIPAEGVTIIGGQGTNALVVDFHTAIPMGTNLIGYLQVKAINASGCESSVVPASSRYYLLPKIPNRPTYVNLTYNGVQKLRVGNFVGDASKTLVLTAFDNSVTATSYHWDLPAGVNVVSGDKNSDKVISINLGDVESGITDLEFNVYADAACGSSLPTILKEKRDLPGTPTALALTNNAISSVTRITNASTYIGTTTPLTLTATPVTTSGYESTSYKWVLPSGIAIIAASATLVSEDSGFKTYTSTSNVIRINLSGVSAVTSLLIKVYGVNGNGESLLSRNLTLTAAVPAAPAALRLTNAAAPSVAVTNVSTYIGTSTPLTLTATASVLATSYQWELPDGVNLVSGATTTSPGIALGISNVITVDFANVAAGTTSLYLGAKGVNGAGVSVTNNSTLVPATSSTARLLRLTAALPAAAVVTGQIAGVCGGNSYSYTITSSLLATSYLITAPTGSVVTSLSNPVNATNVLSTSDLTFTVLYPLGFASTTAVGVGVKSIVISSVNGVGSSLLNRTLALSTLIPALGTVTSTTTGVTTFNQGLTAKVFTVPAILGVIGYNWTVANGAVIVGASNTNSITVDFSAVPVGTLRTIITVSATTPCGTSAVRTITLSFSSAATRLRQETVAVNATEVYPNPVSTNFNIEIAASKAGTVEISVYSVEGVLVVSPKSVQLESGANTITENGSSLKSGIYILQLVNSSNGEVITKKLIKK